MASVFIQLPATGGGSGSVTSVGLADGSSTPIFDITNSPVTGSGTLTESLKTQSANLVLASPVTGAAAQPTFRSLVTADLPVSLMDPTKSTVLYEDFLTGYLSSGGGSFTGNHGWCTQTTGSPSYNLNGTHAPPTNQHPGVFEITATATADGGALLSGTPGGPFMDQFLTGGGIITADFLINLVQLGNGTDDFQILVGLSDGTAFNGYNNAVVFLYNNATNSGKWQYQTKAGGTGAAQNSTTTVTSGYRHLGFVVNAAGTSVTFTVDGVSIGTSVANIPTAKMTPMVMIKKSLGTSAVYLGTDYIYITQTFTTPR